VNALRPGWGLPSSFHTHPEIYRLELENIFYKEWLLVGHDCEIPNVGDWFTIQIGSYPIVVVRDHDGINAFHNVCRHRASKISEGTGTKTRKLVFPYHQWSYGLDGQLNFARDVNENFDKSKNGLLRAHCRSTAGYIFVSVQQEGEPLPFDGIEKMFAPFIQPFDLKNAKVAFQSRIIEKANWKIVWENNRECYHCRGSHPELSNTFPDSPSWVAGDAINKRAQIEFAKMLKVCENHRLPTGYHVSADQQYRIMRIPLLKDQRSMTMNGEPAVKNKRLGSMPLTDNVGDILFYHYPNTWNHFTADHTISFRLMPISPTETELVTKWFVPADAKEGVDYDIKTLTEVWEATNAQDKEIVERQFEGISSPAYQPADFNALHEDGVSAFYHWYTTCLKTRLT
jgi:Rieske 2Fe-2S family protein